MQKQALVNHSSNLLPFLIIGNILNNNNSSLFNMRKITFSISNNFSQSIVLNYKDLRAGKNLTEAIEKAYGPKGKLRMIS